MYAELNDFLVLSVDKMLEHIRMDFLSNSDYG